MLISQSHWRFAKKYDVSCSSLANSCGSIGKRYVVSVAEKETMTIPFSGPVYGSCVVLCAAGSVLSCPVLSCPVRVLCCVQPVASADERGGHLPSERSGAHHREPRRRLLPHVAVHAADQPDVPVLVRTLPGAVQRRHRPLRQVGHVDWWVA